MKRKKIARETIPNNQSKLALACPSHGLTEYERTYPIALGNLILGGGTDSKLFQDVREKNSLCYTISSYFRKLDKLVIGDDIFLVYKNTEYKYKVVDIYDIEKTGKAEIIKNKNTTTITLITCRHGTNKQIVVIAEKKQLTCGL